jgi:hypothetical protein
VRVTRVKGRKQTEWIVLPSAVQLAIKNMPPPLDPGPAVPDGRGLVMDRKGALHYHWSPIRAAFRQTVTDERWEELRAGQSDQRSLDFYALRHFCASIIVDRGGNEYDVAHQLGNTPEVARKVYIHGYRDRVNARNADRLNNVVEEVDVRAAGDGRRRAVCLPCAGDYPAPHDLRCDRPKTARNGPCRSTTNQCEKVRACRDNVLRTHGVEPSPNTATSHRSGVEVASGGSTRAR